MMGLVSGTRTFFARFVTILASLFMSLAFYSFLAQPDNRKDFALLNQHYELWLLLLIFSAMLACAVLWLICGRVQLNSRLCLIVILVMAVLLRLLWICLYDVRPQNDFRFYYEHAQRFVNGDFSGRGYISLFPHTFGYTSFLSLLFGIFGTAVEMAQFANIAISCGVITLVFVLGKILYDDRAGLIAAVIWAFWPSQIFYTELVSTEILFTFMMLFCITLFLKLPAGNKSVAASVLLGLCCAMTNGIRPFGPILIIAFTLAFIYQPFRSRMEKTGVKPSSVILPLCTFLLAYLVFSNVWSLVLSHVIDKPVARSPVGFNLLVGSNLKYEGRWNQEDSEHMNKLLGPAEFNAQEVHDQLAQDSLERIKAQGGKNLGLVIKKFSIMWSSDDDILTYIKAGLNPVSPGSGSFHGVRRYLKLACNLYYAVVVLLCGVFFFWSFRKGINTGQMVMLLIILGVAMIHLVVEVHGRYHFSMMPLFALLAGQGLCKCFIHLNARATQKGSFPH